MAVVSKLVIPRSIHAALLVAPGLPSLVMERDRTVSLIEDVSNAKTCHVRVTFRRQRQARGAILVGKIVARHCEPILVSEERCQLQVLGSEKNYRRARGQEAFL